MTTAPVPFRSVAARLLLLPALLLSSAATAAQCPASPQDQAHILLQALVEDAGLPGIGAAVSIGGRTVWVDGVGFADVEQKLSVTPFTRFRIGSISKPIAAAAIGVLLERKAIDLDVPVQTYVPSFPLKPWPVTTRQLAGHVAGIRDYRGREFYSTESYSNVTQPLAVFQNDPLIFEPGTDYAYATYGWTVVSAAIEGAAKTPFTDFIRAEVLDPLGLLNTTTDRSAEILHFRARFYDFQRAADGTASIRNAPYVDNSNKWAGGGYVSTMTDLVRFGDAHLRGDFLKPETVALLMQPMTLRNGQSTGYGIGWQSEPDLHGRATVGHTGGAVGGSSVLRMWPDARLVIAASTNLTDDPGIRQIGNAIGEIFHPARATQGPGRRLSAGLYRFRVTAGRSATAFDGQLVLARSCDGYRGELLRRDGTRLGRIVFGWDEAGASHLFTTSVDGFGQLMITGGPGGQLEGLWINREGSQAFHGQRLESTLQ